MIHKKIKEISESLKKRQLIQLQSSVLPCKSMEQAMTKIKQLRKANDEILAESLSLVDIVDEFVNKNSQQYDVLAQQLQRQRIQRNEDRKEFQQNSHIIDQKLNQLRMIISQKEMENLGLRVLIQQKQNKFQQDYQQQYSQMAKMQQLYQSQIASKILNLSENNSMEFNKLVIEYEENIRELQIENKRFLHQNQILSCRVEQLMKYINQQQQQNIEENDCLSPRLINLPKRKQSSSSESQKIISSQFSNSSDKQRKCLLSQQDQFYLKQTQPMVLRQILNTEDRKSVNFGEKFNSKPRQYLLQSNQFTSTNMLGNIILKQSMMTPIKQFSSQPKADQFNPYYIFFTLTVQCAKINSGRLEEAAALDLQKQWQKFLQQKVPMHQWYSQICQKISTDLPL